MLHPSSLAVKALFLKIQDLKTFASSLIDCNSTAPKLYFVGD